ncbi:MAG: CsgG/HfaB family protein [Sulfurimonas sp.]|uniref:CsgG/HfaB family protein n=1 Tax=Sulfurimonas sp. TaxID=2022749 RepID=UPI0026095EB3|nr:CsgG/HfaB family protein [Sulfurimonas sp.]MDD2651598.1 CsgG/HfaB family protein [Sulfurimonas sp.]MDD3451409.1 CsgG/HfaB family protein [Sulfurimonas sp.]
MKQMVLWMIFAFLSALFLSGCTQRVTIRALQPAEIDRAAMTKKVSVAYFENDEFSVSNKIETKLYETTIDDKSYFTVVSRKDFNEIITEQKLQSSGLIEVEKAVEVGNLIGAQAIVAGSVSNLSSRDSYYYEKRLRCADKKCEKMREYLVGCTKRDVHLSAEVRMIDIAQGDVIYAASVPASTAWTHCDDDTRFIPTVDAAGHMLADRIAESFIFKLTPHYVNMRVDLIDDPDTKYDDRQKKLLKFALEYIEQNRLDKAEELLTELVDATQQKSYVAFYNLGVVKEAQGVYGEAQNYYKRADTIAIEPVEEINQAHFRISDLIRKHKKAMEQLGQ